MEKEKALKLAKRVAKKKQKDYMMNLVNELKKSPSLNLNLTHYKDGSVYTYFMDFGEVACLHLSISPDNIQNLVKEAKKALKSSLVDIAPENVIISFVYENTLINLPYNKIELWLQKRSESKSQEEALDCNNLKEE